MKRFLTLVLAVILVMSIGVTALGTGYTGEVEPINVLLINADSGEVLYSKNENAAAYSADLIKLMTAYVAAKCLPDLDAVVTVSPYALYNISGGTNIGIYGGEELTVRDLLAGMLLGNGDDCAQALAMYISGSVNAFVTLMNTFAYDLGLSGTTFTTPTGIHNGYQVSTATDMGKLACALLKYPELMEIFSSASYTIPATNMSEKRTINNTNKLIREYEGEASYLYEGATGMISGYNGSAAACLAATAKKNGVNVVCIILGDISPTHTVRWTLAADLFDYAFEQYAPIPAENVLGNIPVIYTSEDGEIIEIKVDFTDVTVKHDTLSECISATVETKDGITGTVVYTDVDGAVIAEIPVNIKETEPEASEDEPTDTPTTEDPSSDTPDAEVPEEPDVQTPAEEPEVKEEKERKKRPVLAALFSAMILTAAIYGAITVVKNQNSKRHTERDSFKVKFRQNFMTFALFAVVAFILIIIVFAILM